jgi:hypothetical protein
MLTESQRVVHTFDGVLDTEYWMMLPKVLSYKISNRWIIQLRWIILEDQFWRSVKIRSDELYSRSLAFLFQSSYTYISLRRWNAATLTPRWEGETLLHLQLVEGMKRWSAEALFDQISDRDLAFQFKAAILTPRWEDAWTAIRRSDAAKKSFV